MIHVGVKFGLLMQDKAGNPLCPNDHGTKRLLKLKHASEVGINGATGYVMEFYVTHRQYTPKLIADCKRKVENIMKCKSCTS